MKTPGCSARVEALNRHEMGHMRICFIVERFLGHVNYFDRLRSHIDNQVEFSPEYLYMENLRFPLRLVSNAAIPLLKDFDLDLHAARWQITYSYSARRRLQGILSKNRFDGLYFHTQNVALLSSGIAEAYPVVLSMDATNTLLSNMGYSGRLPFTKATWKPGIILERQILKRARRIIAWSEWVRKSLLTDYGVADERISVVPPFVPFPQEKINRVGNPIPRLLFVGRNFVPKGGYDLLRCFKETLRRKCELHIVTTSKIPQNEENVFVHTNASRGEIEHLYATSDIFVYPTRVEAFGQVIAEAMSFGLPVVTTRVAAIPEMVHHGRNGFLTNPGNVDELGEYVNRLVDDPAMRKRMGAESEKLAHERFDFAINAQRICDILREECS